VQRSGAYDPNTHTNTLLRSRPEQSGFDQAEGALLDNRKQERAKPSAAQLNAGPTPRSATDIAAREH
jgi:hypothetical protein